MTESENTFTSVWCIHGNRGDLTLSDVFVVAETIEEAVAAARNRLDPISAIWLVEYLGRGLR